MIVFHPDIGQHSNFGEINRKISRELDYYVEETPHSWFSDSPFLFDYKWNGSEYEFDFIFEVVNLHTGEKYEKGTRQAKKNLHRYITFRPRVLLGCPVCRRTRVTKPDGNLNWSEVCPSCHNSRLFVYFVTGKQDVRDFCEYRMFERPPHYGGLL